MSAPLDLLAARCHHQLVSALSAGVANEGEIGVGAAGAASLPRRFGPYALIDKIGEGGMAEIFLAHTSMGLGAHKRLVVKLILPLLAQNQTFCQLLINEAKLSAKLSHGNIVQVFDLGREEDMLYIAMEYIEGLDLRQLLRECAARRVSLPLDYAVFIVTQVLEGLSYAHNKRDESGHLLSIVHRDVSPSNVLLSLEGEVKLCDFGIARALGVSSAIPDDAIQGKAGYMSPEAANGLSIDACSDVFSAGVILWELLSGKRLYKGEKGKAPPLLLAQRAEIAQLQLPGIPGGFELEQITMRALHKDPAERYSSAGEMREALESYLERHDWVPSPLGFGRWLREHCAPEIIERRRALEQSYLASPSEPVSETTDHSHITSAKQAERQGIASNVADQSTEVGPVTEVPVAAAKALSMASQYPPPVQTLAERNAGQVNPGSQWRRALVFLVVIAVAFALGALVRLR